MIVRPLAVKDVAMMVLPLFSLTPVLIDLTMLLLLRPSLIASVYPIFSPLEAILLALPRRRCGGHARQFVPLH